MRMLIAALITTAVPRCNGILLSNKKEPVDVLGWGISKFLSLEVREHSVSEELPGWGRESGQEHRGWEGAGRQMPRGLGSLPMSLDLF